MRRETQRLVGRWEYVGRSVGLSRLPHWDLRNAPVGGAQRRDNAAGDSARGTTREAVEGMERSSSVIPLCYCLLQRRVVRRLLRAPPVRPSWRASALAWRVRSLARFSLGHCGHCVFSSHSGIGDTVRKLPVAAGRQSQA
jgi:hypothetical protein